MIDHPIERLEKLLPNAAKAMANATAHLEGERQNRAILTLFLIVMVNVHRCENRKQTLFDLNSCLKLLMEEYNMVERIDVRELTATFATDYELERLRNPDGAGGILQKIKEVFGEKL